LAVSVVVSFYRPVFCVYALILLLCSTISLYVQSKFGIIFDDIMLVNALDSLGHIADVWDFSLLVYLLIFWIFPAAILIIKKTKKSSIKKRIVTALLCFVLAVGSVLSGDKIKREFTFENFSPINYLGSFERYLTRFHKNRQIAKNRISLTKHYNFSAEQLPKNLKIILVLGESLRADHLQINGYKRKTTPELVKIKGLINFQVQGRFNTTSPALTALLSHRNFEDFVDIPEEKSLIDIFRRIGFHTSWFSAQSSKEFGNGMLNVMAMEADEYFFRDRLKTVANNEKIYDEALLPFLREELRQERRSLVVLHGFGSHIRYTDRYPSKFAKFLPECEKSPSSCEVQSLINAYDNSILYTDFFLKEVINSIKNEEAVMFYISDHGNFLGEEGQFANGNRSKAPQNVHIVPMLIFPSKELLGLAGYKQKFQQAQINSKGVLSGLLERKKPNQDYKKPIEQRAFFDSVLDCVGIKSDLFKKRNLSLCKKLSK